jgi:uracil permease
MFALIKAFGTGFIQRLVPSVIVGPVVMIIGLALADVAVVQMASVHWPTAIFTLVMTILFSVFGRGFFKVIPILLGIISGYLFAVVFQMVEPGTLIKMGDKMVPLISFDRLEASVHVQALKDFFHIPQFVMPSFKWGAIMAIAPIALVAIIEDLGHILVIGNITKRELVKDPGFDRVLLGNGIATSVAALFGGPPSTTYGENIGVLAITRVFSARVIQTAAVVAILLSFLNPVRVAIATIPVPVMGGIVILLFGMIAAAGIRSMIEAKSDLSSTRNLIIVSIILILGVGLKNVGYATLAGIILNLILPQEKPEEQSITTLEADTVEETK